MLHIIIIIIIINHIYAGYLAILYLKQPMFMYNIAAIMYVQFTYQLYIFPLWTFCTFTLVLSYDSEMVPISPV